MDQPGRNAKGAAMLAVHHVGITVRDLERSASFYHDVIGLQFVLPPTDWFEGEDLARGLGVVPPVSLRVALFEVGAAATWFEILEYRTPPSIAIAAPPQNEIGAAHVALHVTEIDTEYRRLSALGVRFNSPVNVVDDGPLAGWRWVYFKDPDDHTVELVEVAYVNQERRNDDLRRYLASRGR
jgi:catechol 2,3-dioxygenase-like lactoylglutathione lyase family enzyme